MPAPHWFCIVLLLSAAGCGRVGVQLFLRERDASTQPTDAGARRDAGQPSSAGRAGSESGAGGGAAADGGIDAAMPYQGDASTPTTMDATVSMPTDGGNATDAGNPTNCGGAVQFELCWYLAAEDTSCNDECANKDGFDNRALNYIGTPSQGGSEQECEQILTALGRPGSVATGTQQIGLGCHIWTNGDRWWLQSPAFTANAATPKGTSVRTACACQN